MTSILFLVLTVWTWSLVTSQREPVDNNGTTKSLEQVFKGRCWDYNVTKYKGILSRVPTSCEELWDSFFKGFAYQPPCAVQQSAYDQFYSLARQELPTGKVLFWSGVNALAHKYAEVGRRYVTLEDTMIGYLADNLTWCGQSTDPGINYIHCPTSDECPEEARESYWAGASSQFAKQAKGVVSVMLDGSRFHRPPYNKDRLFAKYELPNLTKNVTLVRALVTYGLWKPWMEICGMGSLADLEDEVKYHGFNFQCINQPRDILYLLCADDPTCPECQLAKERTGLPYLKP